MVKHAMPLPSHCKLFHPRPSLGLQVLKTFVVINQNAFFLKILHSRIHFLFIHLESKLLDQSDVQNKSKTPLSVVTQ